VSRVLDVTLAGLGLLVTSSVVFAFASSATLLDAARLAQDVLGRPLGSHVLTAGPVDWHAGAQAER
jgi:hypothetical protein